MLWLHGRVRIDVLGSIAVTTGSVTRTPRGDRLRDVLALLVTHRGRSLTSEAILDRVWDEESGQFDPSVVHTVFARLRREFGGDLVVRDAAGYRLGPEVETDIAGFERSVAAARDAERAEDVGELEIASRAALAVWRGPEPFEGVPDSLVLGERARLQKAHWAVTIRLIRALVDADAGRAQHQEAWERSTALLASQPLDESAAALALTAGRRLGFQAEAFEIFERLRGALREELGINPGAEVMAAHAELLASPLQPVTVPNLPFTAAPLPPSPTSPTVGRESEISAVLAAVSAGHRLVTVTGTGGVGKTRLLAEVGRRLSGRPTTYVPLGSLEGRSSTEIAIAVALAHGVALALDPVGELVESLADSRLVILADEAEWALESVGEVVRAVLAGAPGVSVIMSSRQPLDLVGERVVPLAPLSVPPRGATIEQILASPAVQLLLDRASLLAPPTSEAALRALAEAARQVDGLPLALELLAGSGTEGDLAGLQEAAAQPLDLVSHEPDRPQRQRSLSETIRWSTSRLGEAEAIALRRLAVLAGPFDVPTAAAVIGRLPQGAEAPVALRRLIRVGLVHTERTGSQATLRLRLLRAVRDLGVEELLSRGELVEARKRHRSWFAERWRGQPLSEELIDDVAERYDDYMAALRDAAEESGADQAADLALTLARLWIFRESAVPGLEWLDRVLAMPGLSAAQRARLRITRAGLGYEHEWNEATILSTLAEDSEWLGQGLLSLSIAAYLRGDLELGVSYARMMLSVARTGAPHLLPEALGTLAVMEETMGEDSSALAHVREAEAFVGRSPSILAAAAVLPKLALVLSDLDQHEKAADLLALATHTLTKGASSAPTPTVTVNAAWAALGSGDSETAQRLAAQVMGTAQARSIVNLAVETAVVSGCALVRLGRPSGQGLLAAALAQAHAGGVVLSRGAIREVDRTLAVLPDDLPEPPDWDIPHMIDVATKG